MYQFINKICINKFNIFTNMSLYYVSKILKYIYLSIYIYIYLSEGAAQR